ncbi:bud site selection protein [Anaeramoeba flamelloides]|uniref:Bud site selection protein n=1 Tax=Anaeramoeba flamelloides TaxID=1746091 RepID=A0ABQ8Y873_9EUKA|nr:bud site selection protein [Anaeramoeba flamelloides]
MADSISELYEFVEVSLSESILTRQTQLIHRLGTFEVPDLVHLVKEHVTKQNELTLQGFYHHVCGVDFSLGVSAVAAYFGSLLSRQEKRQGFLDRTSWRIISGTFCSYDPFNRRDLRVEFSLPGNFRVCWLGLDGREIEITTEKQLKRAWECLYVASFVRSSCTIPAFKEFRSLIVLNDLVTSHRTRLLRDESAVLRAVRHVYKQYNLTKLWRRHDNEIPSQAINVLTFAITKYFFADRRYDQCAKFFWPLLTKSSEFAVQIAKSWIKAGRPAQAVSLCETAIRAAISKKDDESKKNKQQLLNRERIIENFQLKQKQKQKSHSETTKELKKKTPRMEIRKEEITRHKKKKEAGKAKEKVKGKERGQSKEKEKNKERGQSKGNEKNKKTGKEKGKGNGKGKVDQINEKKLFKKYKNSIAVSIPLFRQWVKAMLSVGKIAESIEIATSLSEALPFDIRTFLLLSKIHLKEKNYNRVLVILNNLPCNNENELDQIKKNCSTKASKSKLDNTNIIDNDNDDFNSNYNNNNNNYTLSKNNNGGKRNNNSGNSGKKHKKRFGSLSSMCPSPLRITQPMHISFSTPYFQTEDNFKKAKNNSSIFGNMPGELIKDQINFKFYQILCKLYSLIGWKALLQVRSEVFEFLKFDSSEKTQLNKPKWFGQKINKLDLLQKKIINENNLSGQLSKSTESEIFIKDEDLIENSNKSKIPSNDNTKILHKNNGNINSNEKYIKINDENYFDIMFENIGLSFKKAIFNNQEFSYKLDEDLKLKNNNQYNHNRTNSLDNRKKIVIDKKKEDHQKKRKEGKGNRKGTETGTGTGTGTGEEEGKVKVKGGRRKKTLQLEGYLACSEDENNQQDSNNEQVYEWELEERWFEMSESEIEDFQQKSQKNGQTSQQEQWEKALSDQLEEEFSGSLVITTPKVKKRHNKLKNKSNSNNDKKKTKRQLLSFKERKSAPFCKLFVVEQFSYEKWFDNLFNFLYKEVKIYTEIKYEQENKFFINEDRIYRTTLDWERYGDLCIRLNQKKDAIYGYYCAIKSSRKFGTLSFWISLKLLKIFSKEGSILKVFQISNFILKSEKVFLKNSEQIFMMRRVLKSSIFELIRRRGLKTVQKFLEKYKHDISNDIVELIEAGTILKVYGYDR